MTHTPPKEAYVAKLDPDREFHCIRCNADDYAPAVILVVHGMRQYCDRHARELLAELKDALGEGDGR